MSYTNIELVRHHLEFAQPVMERIFNQQVIIDTDERISFFNGGIQLNSVLVKSLHEVIPSKICLTLVSGSTVISNAPIVTGTVVCASDSSLGTVYTENADFVIDHKQGTISIKTGGVLSAGMSVTVFYLPYSLYEENNDYRIDYESGEIWKISSGKIQSGEIVYLDYDPIYQNYSDAVMNNAVVEANAIIEMTVDPNREFGADLVLQSAATYRALEIICRGSAARELIGISKNDKAAQTWLKLAESYHIRSNELIKSFSEPKTGPIAPTHS